MSNKKKRPNVIFILSDQHNAKVLGCKGHPDVKTPNLDKIAENGVLFDNAINQNPICTPSRISWLSGQYCHNHGYYALNGPNPRGLPNMLGYLRHNDYTTATIGKIHCPEYWIEDGCDVFLDSAESSASGSKEYNAYLKSKGLLEVEDYHIFSEFGEKGRQTCDARLSKLAYVDSQEGWIAQKAIDFMTTAKKQNKPFIAHVSFPRPHQCYAPSEQFWSMYDEQKLSLPPNTDYEMKDKAPHMKKTAEKWKNGEWTLFEPKTFEAGRLRKLHGYLGCVSQVDHAVGELMKWLNENDMEEDTIVVYSSDHGDYACEHDIMEKAPGICSDAITRVPFLWYWPGHFKSGHISEEIVETVDLVSTICLLLGLDTLETSDGKNISHLLYGDSGEVHKIGVTENVWSKSVRKGKYRFVYYPDSMFIKDYPEGFGELYNLENDSWEMTNLYFNNEYSDVVAEMKNDLLEWIITTTRPVSVLGVRPENSNQRITRYKKAVNMDGKIHPEWIKEIEEDGKINYI